MTDWLLSRPTIIGLAVGGSLISLLASWCRSRQWVSEPGAAWMNKTAYLFMAASMILFVSAGLLDTEK